MTGMVRGVILLKLRLVEQFLIDELETRKSSFLPASGEDEKYVSDVQLTLSRIEYVIKRMEEE